MNEKRLKELADKKKHTPEEKRELDNLLEEKCKEMRNKQQKNSKTIAFA